MFAKCLMGFRPLSYRRKKFTWCNEFYSVAPRQNIFHPVFLHHYFMNKLLSLIKRSCGEPCQSKIVVFLLIRKPELKSLYLCISLNFVGWVKSCDSYHMLKWIFKEYSS